MPNKPLPAPQWDTRCFKCGQEVPAADWGDECPGNTIRDVNIGWDGHDFDYIGPLNPE